MSLIVLPSFHTDQMHREAFGIESSPHSDQDITLCCSDQLADWSIDDRQV